MIRLSKVNRLSIVLNQCKLCLFSFKSYSISFVKHYGKCPFTSAVGFVVGSEFCLGWCHIYKVVLCFFYSLPLNRLLLI